MEGSEHNDGKMCTSYIFSEHNYFMHYDSSCANNFTKCDENQYHIPETDTGENKENTNFKVIIQEDANKIEIKVLPVSKCGQDNIGKPTLDHIKEGQIHATSSSNTNGNGIIDMQKRIKMPCYYRHKGLDGYLRMLKRRQLLSDKMRTVEDEIPAWILSRPKTYSSLNQTTNSQENECNHHNSSEGNQTCSKVICSESVNDTTMQPSKSVTHSCLLGSSCPILSQEQQLQNTVSDFKPSSSYSSMSNGFENLSTGSSTVASQNKDQKKCFGSIEYNRQLLSSQASALDQQKTSNVWLNSGANSCNKTEQPQRDQGVSTSNLAYSADMLPSHTVKGTDSNQLSCGSTTNNFKFRLYYNTNNNSNVRTPSDTVDAMNNYQFRTNGISSGLNGINRSKEIGSHQEGELEVTNGDKVYKNVKKWERKHDIFCEGYLKRWENMHKRLLEGVKQEEKVNISKRIEEEQEEKAINENGRTKRSETKNQEYINRRKIIDKYIKEWVEEVDKKKPGRKKKNRSTLDEKELLYKTSVGKRGPKKIKRTNRQVLYFKNPWPTANSSGSARTEPISLDQMNWRKTDAQTTDKCKAGPVSHPSYRTGAVTDEKQIEILRYSQFQQMKQNWRSYVYVARSNIQGMGLFAARDIERSTMIIEYIGEIIRIELAECRERKFKHRGTYTFKLDDERVVDAMLAGGLARYINHSCKPNCFAETIEVDGHLKIVLFAKRRIRRKEELTYDYKFDIEDDGDKITCLCKATNCRKWMN